LGIDDLLVRRLSKDSLPAATAFRPAFLVGGVEVDAAIRFFLDPFPLCPFDPIFNFFATGISTLPSSTFLLELRVVTIFE